MRIENTVFYCISNHFIPIRVFNKVAEENDTDGTLHKWFKENYFEKDDQKEAMKEHFQLSDTDLKKFSGKKKK